MLVNVAEDWGKISEDAKNLIKKMLEKDPNKRISAKDAYNDPWIQKNAPSEKIDTKALKNMTNFYVSAWSSLGKKQD